MDSRSVQVRRLRRPLGGIVRDGEPAATEPTRDPIKRDGRAAATDSWIVLRIDARLRKSVHDGAGIITLPFQQPKKFSPEIREGGDL